MVRVGLADCRLKMHVYSTEQCGHACVNSQPVCVDCTYVCGVWKKATERQES